MGLAAHRINRIKIGLALDKDKKAVATYQRNVAAGSLGNPHCRALVIDLFNIDEWGPLLEQS